MQTKTEWEMRREIMLSSLSKLQLDSREVKYEDLMWCGKLHSYNRAFDRITTKLERSSPRETQSWPCVVFRPLCHQSFVPILISPCRYDFCMLSSFRCVCLGAPPSNQTTARPATRLWGPGWRLVSASPRATGSTFDFVIHVVEFRYELVICLLSRLSGFRMARISSRFQAVSNDLVRAS